MCLGHKINLKSHSRRAATLPRCSIFRRLFDSISYALLVRSHKRTALHQSPATNGVYQWFHCFILLSVVLGLDGCNGCQQQIPKPFNIHNISHGVGAETTVAVVPTGQQARNYVIAFMGGASWAVSPDQGKTWAPHKDSDVGFAWGAPAEMPGAWSYGVDPTLVTTGRPNQVAFVSAASGREVAIALSTDGGVHFGNVHLVSTPTTGSIDPQPTAGVNAATGEIWVAWTQKPTYRLMVRALHYDANGTLFFDTAPTEVNRLPGLSPISPGTEVNLTVAAGTYKGLSHVALAYADKYEDASCPGPLNLTYYIADSTDNGQTWQTQKIVHDASWPQCVTTGNPKPELGYNRDRPAIAFAGGVAINYYVALTQSSPTGSLVHLYRVSWPFQENSVRDFGTTPPDDHLRHDQFAPAIAVGYSSADVNASGRTAMNVMVTWHDTRADANGGNLRQLIYGSVTGLGNWTGVVSPATGAANEHVPWVIRGWWGDYEGLAADDVSHRFVAVWCDNRFDGPPAVWSSVLTPLQN